MKALVVLAGASLVAAGLLVYWTGAEERQPSSGGITLLTAKELASPKDALAQGATGVTWYAPSLAPGSWPDQAAGQASAEAAIRDAANRLAGVNYHALSLPAFDAETASLVLQPADFTSGRTYLDSRGVGGNDRWEVYGWRGLEFPQKADRPLVQRYVQVYALYDVNQKKVIKLLATITGEALE